ncbi:protein TIFY 9-like isoform X1 [Zingiber officinale]|uniref:protein TIFY 9-like isoform X1 n=1 Tax=Zingiber officinale TaxID=94328 RepID=UPI001C4C9C38|nr:protein TIFY 9-like isoform X1 [Zingiber officinale]
MAEHDFFQIEKQNAARYGVVDGRSSARGIQSVVSRINPQLLRSVIAPGPASMWPANAALLLSSSSPPPVTAPNPSVRSVTEISKETMPLTIFYRGTVAVFDLPRDKVGHSLFPIPFPFSPFSLKKNSLKGTTIKFFSDGGDFETGRDGKCRQCNWRNGRHEFAGGPASDVSEEVTAAIPRETQAEVDRVRPIREGEGGGRFGED